MNESCSAHTAALRRVAELEQFGGNYVAAEMVRGFLDSSEYRRRFGR